MKKVFAIMGAALFMLSFGIAYAGGLSNGVTDFSGKTYDLIEISPAVNVEHNAFESSAAGGIRMTEIDKEQLHNGITDFTGRSYDMFELSVAPADGNVAEGSAAGGLRQNWAGEKTSVTSYEESNLMR